ncbi:MAG: hypothetical protein Q9188_006093 [Gyalolechia gomerana]
MSSLLPTFPASHAYPLPYYTTTTTTLTSTITATVGAILHLTIPTPSSSIPTSYTTPPLPTSSEGKEYPLGLPILVLTQLDAAVFDPERGSVIMTATTVQGTPDAPTVTEAGSAGSAQAYKLNGWSDWTYHEVGGVIAAIVITAVVTLMSLCWCAKRRRVWEKRGRRNMMKKGGRGWWRTEHVPNRDVAGAETKFSKKGWRMRSDDEESSVGRNRQESSKGTAGSTNTVARLGGGRTVQHDEAQVEAVQALSPAKEVYQMSGARQSTPSPVSNLQGQPVPGSQNTQQGYLAPHPISEGSRGTMSAYRLMREQERRQERAIPYPQVPVQQQPQST